MAMTMMFCTVLVAAYCLLILRISRKSLQRSIMSAINKAMPSLLLLMMVGLLFASWLFCGTIPAMIHYDRKVVRS